MLCPLCSWPCDTDLEMARHLLALHQAKMIRGRSAPHGTVKVLGDRIGCFCWAAKVGANLTRVSGYLQLQWLYDHFTLYGGFEKHYADSILERYFEVPIVRPATEQQP